MNLTINRRIFDTTRFDSGSLGVLASIVHQFKQPGMYRLEVMRDSRRVTTMDFEVNDQSGEPKLAIDLSKLVGPSRDADSDPQCSCGQRVDSGVPSVSTNGYVLFSASAAESGFAAVVSAVDDEELRPVYSTEKLQKDDYFALSLIEPGSFSMKNSMCNAEGKIVVLERERDGSRLDPKAMETRYVLALEDRFDPEEVTLMPAQGLVFKIQTPSRIVVERTSKSVFEGFRRGSHRTEVP